ncbi:hypothetical protein A0J61_00428 [Choanephora cucurbitarum]|uniref:Arrestin-like N-terminal domain-containing protein n=1 Tax=Choanephora cucurbitarum TaxID=101091 RepID=A0A1C7NSG3_9FUNG|nr:hypothetical protein A0J61_00428 [Choanephora cucurbitarum]
MRLVGKEQIGDKTFVIVDDIYHLSSRPNDWRMMNNNTYQLGFGFSVPSNIPSSFEDRTASPSKSICYTIQITTSLAPETCWIRPIYFHQSITEESLPKRVFWGVAKLANNQAKWQYELEFPNMFHLDITKSEHVFVRMRSLGQPGIDTCCLIGCQIVQVIHMEGYKCQNQIVAATAKLLRKPNTSWNNPFKLTYEPSELVLPTVEGQKLSIEHYIKFTFAFNDLKVESNMNFEFPVLFMGNLNKSSTHTIVSTRRPMPTVMSSSPSSVSSCNSLKEETRSHDSALDMTVSPDTSINYFALFVKKN